MKKKQKKEEKLKEELILEADEELEAIDEEKDLKDELVEETDEEIEDTEENKVARLEDQLKRMVADYQNLEKRTEEKRSEWIMTSNAGLIKKLLPVLDNLFLAAQHIQNDGLNLSIQKFLDVLKEEGVMQINTKDEEFNPHLMECVSVAAGEENKVLEEVRKGFIMNDIVLRPAQVIVGSVKQS